MASSPITSFQIDGETMETVRNFTFLGSKITADGDCGHEIKRCLLLGGKAMTSLDSILNSRHYFANKGPSSQSYGFSSVMYRCESWTIKKAEHWRIDAFELWCWKKFLSPLDCKESQPVNPKGNWSWIFIGRTDFEAETPILWPPDVKNWLIWKDPDARKDRRQEEKGMTEDLMVWWHHEIDGHEFEKAPGVGDGQGSLACCSLLGCKELDMTERLNWRHRYRHRWIHMYTLIYIHILIYT